MAAAGHAQITELLRLGDDCNKAAGAAIVTVFAAVLKRLKQHLDKAAIYGAANALPRTPAAPEQYVEAKHLLANEQLLVPPEITPELTFSDSICFSFSSALASPSPVNNRVHGKLFRTLGRWQHKPLVLIIHGWNAELHYLKVCPLLARGLNRRGMNAAMVELPYHLQRRPAGSEFKTDFICNHIPGMLQATRQAIADMHSMLRWARAQGCPSTALWGFSLGGWLAGLHLCMSSLQDAALLTIPVSNLEQAVRELEFCHPIRSALAVAPVGITALNLASHQPKIAPARIRLMQSEYDLFVPAATYGELARAWGLRTWDKVPHSHISVLFAPSPMRKGMDWLSATLLGVTPPVAGELRERAN